LENRRENSYFVKVLNFSSKSMKKIIYIDDEFLNLELFRINLQNHYDVVVTESPLEALKIIDKENIDVIITDYKMPDMNGMELIIKVKKEIRPGAVCMILSGYLEGDVSTDNSLVYKYIMKPYKKQQMIDHIEAAFRQFSLSA
jgi:DNA-binding NtrC family response regulator